MTWHPTDALEQSEPSNPAPQESTQPVQLPSQVQPGLRATTHPSQPAASARPPPVAGFAKNSDSNHLEHLNSGESSDNASVTTPSSIRIDCVVR
nr:hypothetical protein [Rhodopirellula europaea]